MIFFKKYLFKILLSTLIILFLIIAPFPLFNKIMNLNYSLNSEYKLEYSGVFELWNVDTFEGGSLNRSAFLEKRSLEFEKIYRGVYFSIKSMTKEQLILNLENGKKPDMITYGIGVGEYIVDDLISLNSSYMIREDLIAGGKEKSQIKALPIMLGGYVLITNKEQINCDNHLLKNITSYGKKLIYSSTEDISPLFSLALNDISLKKQEIINVDSFDAYDKFINEKYSILLGTQRDFYRCRNRESNLKMQCEYEFLSGYSDLIQYASIFKGDKRTETICEKFIEYLLSKNCQKNLANIGMFPTISEIIYEDEKYKEFNEVLLKDLKTINIFTKNDDIKNLQSKLIDNVFNGNDNKKEILKYLCG